MSVGEEFLHSFGADSRVVGDVAEVFLFDAFVGGNHNERVLRVMCRSTLILCASGCKRQASVDARVITFLQRSEERGNAKRTPALA